MRTTTLFATLVATVLLAVPAASGQQRIGGKMHLEDISLGVLKPAGGGPWVGLAQVGATDDGRLIGNVLYAGGPAGQKAAAVWSITDRCDGTLTTFKETTFDDEATALITFNMDFTPFRSIGLTMPGEQGGQLLACGTLRSFSVAPSAGARTGAIATAAFFGPNVNTMANVLAPPRGRPRLEALLTGLRPGRAYGLVLSRRACSSSAAGSPIARVRFKANAGGYAPLKYELQNATVTSIRAARSVGVVGDAGRGACARATVVHTYQQDT